MIRKFALVISFLVLSSVAKASPILHSFTDPAIFGSQDNFLGYSFLANNNITISKLGFWDNGQDGLSTSHEVALYDSGQTLLGLVTVGGGAGGELVGDFLYGNLASSVDLTAGMTYFLAGSTAGDDWVYQASNITTDPNITYQASYFTSGTGGSAAFPGSMASDREYMTVNAFIGEAEEVPVPATLALFGLGLVGLGWSKRKKA